MKDAKKDILIRVYGMYFLVCLFGLAILFNVITIQFFEGDEWIAKAESLSMDIKNIEAVRGNIYAEDGSMLATSVPIYEVHFDPNTESISDEFFNDNVDTLSMNLASLLQDRTAVEWKRKLTAARDKGSRYMMIKRNANYNELKALRSFPIFEKGRYKGGFIFMQQNKRKKPFRLLAARTIGYDREGVQPVGLEGAYQAELKGVDGKRLMQKIAGGVWMPIGDENEIDPEDGSDVITTIDINIQDVAEKALLNELLKHDADHGCVVLMEVSTGEVKAISNLSRNSDGSYYENYNYAIGESTEPGSTFKLASVMAGLEDGHFDVTDSVDTEDGTHNFYDCVMRDSHRGGYGKITLHRAVELSSNVAISKKVTEAYTKHPQGFIDRLCKIGLNKKLGVEITGEGEPFIKNSTDKSWSGCTIPWMSIGYELQMTPLQILTFYNAIANDGVMVKPMFVSEIQQRGNVVKKNEVTVLNNAICSSETLKKIQAMLVGVVQNGTAKNLQHASYKIAGKTGTAQIANDKYGYHYKSKVSHQASFTGYFPADNPKYSCIVVVNAPSRNVYYGNLVAGPIFKEIADKVYANTLEIHDKYSGSPNLAATRIPVSKNGSQEDLLKVFEEIDVDTKVQSEGNDWTVTLTNTKHVDVKVRKVVDGLVPNVVGMGASDAMYLLENMGLNVMLEGRGVVKKQSLASGLKLVKGNQIKLELS